jgi:hypothetical protein
MKKVLGPILGTGRNIIVPAVSYGCETWFHPKGRTQLRVFQNRVLRKTVGPKRDEVAGSWKKLHNEELLNLYSPNT